MTRRRIFEEICEQIRRKLARGDYKPGDKLPTERDLAIEFGVGRPAVREALRTLENSGVLQLKKGVKGGAFVREGDPQIVTQSLHDLMNLGHVSLSALREARIVLTDSVLKMACVRGTKEDFDAIEHSIDLSERLETYGDFNERVIAGTDFFRLIAVAAHNEVLTVLVDSLTAIVRHVVTQVHPPTTAHIDLRRKILAAMRARKPTLARTHLHRFFEVVQEEILKAQQPGAAGNR